MILNKINFSTGPVALHEKVKLALIDDPISHRSNEFRYLMNNICGLYKDEFNVKDVYFLTGSGTTANEAMILQIKMLKKSGLILSNGEFGNRLINQAIINNVQFSIYKKDYGHKYDFDEVDELLMRGNIHWILFAHCETSTGIINDLPVITHLCKKYRALCFADCISSAGALKIDLSQVAMATASSGKGLCGIAGIGIIFSNLPPETNKQIPACLDLTNYSLHKVPFTISSNLISALYTGSKLKLHQEGYEFIAEASQQISHLLHFYEIETFNTNSHVFTIISSHPDETEWLANELSKLMLITSYKSEYLQKNNWLQIALFSIYTKCEMQEGVNRLKSLLSCKVLS